MTFDYRTFLFKLSGMHYSSVNPIRNYFKSIQEKIKDISVSEQEIKHWAFWALEQADKIDPVKTLSFLNYKKYENSREENKN